MAIEWASFGSFLLERPVASTRIRDARVAGTSSTLTLGDQLLGQQVAQPTH